MPPLGSLDMMQMRLHKARDAKQAAEANANTKDLTSKLNARLLALAAQSPPKPFKTQKTQLAELSAAYDCLHGNGASEALFKAKPGPTTFKNKIGWLMAAMPTPVAKTPAPTPAPQNPKAVVPVRITSPAPTANVASANAVMLRTEFDKMTPGLKGDFLRKGGRLTNDTVAANTKAIPAPTLTRAAFMNLSPQERLTFCQLGGKLT